MKSFYLVCMSAVFAVIVLLNICQYLLKTFNQQVFGWSNIQHPGLLVQQDYQFFIYFWVDFMFGLFLFWLTFLKYSIWYRLGTAKMVLVGMIIFSGAALLYYGEVLGTWISWLAGLNITPFNSFNLIGATGLLLLSIRKKEKVIFQDLTPMSPCPAG